MNWRLLLHRDYAAPPQARGYMKNSICQMINSVGIRVCLI
jgi:hypothetical protein